MPIYNPPGGGVGGTTITTKDEGSTLSSTVTTLDFVGAGVTASGAGATTTVTIAGGAGTFAVSSAEVDFGSGAGKYNERFTVTDAAITASHKIMVTAGGNAATSRALGDDEWDAITYSAKAGTGSFTVYANANRGPVTGKRTIYYTYS